MEVTSLDLGADTCRGIWLRNGWYWHVDTLLVANGAWMRELLPVPIQPHKGQSIALRMPANQPPLLKRVLFGQDSYICPKPADGRIIIGATVEPGAYDANVTPAGMLHILSHAVQLVPALAQLPIESTWAGLRPTTPDKAPILGSTGRWKNVLVAADYWRNGVLLAPKTGQLLASLMVQMKKQKQNQQEQQSQPLVVQLPDATDQALLEAFGWDRFVSRPTAAAVTARYAASMHPVQGRTAGPGVAAAVGTELGSYSTARSAAAERANDRAFFCNPRTMRNPTTTTPWNEPPPWDDKMPRHLSCGTAVV